MLEFLFGGFIAYIFLYIQKYHAKIIQIPYLPYFLLGLGVAFSLDWMTIPDNHYINGMASVAIFATVVLLDAILRFKPAKFLMFLGSISYTLYLTHFTTLILLNKALDYYALSYMKNTVFYIFFSSTICVLAASLLYNFIEKIPSNYVRRKLQRLAMR
ncbi:hypothetical protein Abci_003_116 [Acetobacter cibinongensis]|uniref:Acyltransferase 3 domain-containing protein n=2 Tax=Acetobacter cibinongensis TaxID=146475 RepID=A0A0D6N1B9_9PROT|nr:hypothetical protein Abci_003_116 [Acetobacter cibinongensis]